MVTAATATSSSSSINSSSDAPVRWYNPYGNSTRKVYISYGDSTRIGYQSWLRPVGPTRVGELI